MKEKPTSTKRAESPRGGATRKDGSQTRAEPRRETRRRIRKIVERHRETLDYLTDR